jgi:hypothetical protein
VTTGKSVDSEPRAVFVNIGALAIPQLALVSPASGNRETTLTVTVIGANTNFTSGSVSADFGAGVTVLSVSAVDATHLTATIVIGADAPLGFHDVVVTANGQTAALLGGFFVDIQSAASIVSVSPASAYEGQKEQVTILGSNTAFSAGATKVSFGEGVQVLSTQVIDATTIEATIEVERDAALGARDLSVTTGTNTVTLASGFRVTEPIRAHAPALFGLIRHGIHAQPTRLVVTYDEAMDPVSAELRANYVVVDLGRDMQLGTRDDRIRKIASAIYDPATDSVRLRTRRRLPLRHEYALVINSSGPEGVKNALGLSLDGQKNGQPGSPSVTLFGPEIVVGRLEFPPLAGFGRFAHHSHRTANPVHRAGHPATLRSSGIGRMAAPARGFRQEKP